MSHLAAREIRNSEPSPSKLRLRVCHARRVRRVGEMIQHALGWTLR
jgi:hypothetical protein